jgi:hypothetical protein
LLRNSLVAPNVLFLSGRQCDEVEGEAERRKCAHQQIPDPIVAPNFWSINTAKLVAFAAVCTLTVSLLAMGFDLDKAGAAAGIIALLMTVALGVLPERFTLAIRRRPVRTVFIIALPLSAGGVLCIATLLAACRAQSGEIRDNHSGPLTTVNR